VIRAVESDPEPPVVASVAALSSVPTSVVQPDQPTGPQGSEVPWVSNLLSEFSKVSQDPLPAGLPPERSERHSIPTEPGHPPPFRSMYRLSPLEYRELEKQVTKFLKNGILEVSQSPYGAHVLFVPKPNGRGLRLCLDYRALNSITVKNRFTIPRIDDLLDAVAESEYFTSLDLTSGYHQILISEEDRPKTAFQTPFGHFQFKVLIEGLTDAPTTFQTVMNSIFHPYIRKFVVVYIDDILIFSKTEAEHQAHVRLVLEMLKRERFYVCKANSSFAQKEIKYLGHIVDKQGIRPGPKKVEAVQTWPVPKNVHDVRSCIEKVYKVGDKVLLSTKYLNLKHSETNRKLLPKWIGPFEVVQVVGPVAYKLRMNPGWRVHPVFHVSLLELYRENGRVQPPPPPIEMEGALEYEVESILEH
jgi:hypothetical protein